MSLDAHRDADEGEMWYSYVGKRRRRSGADFGNDSYSDQLHVRAVLARASGKLRWPEFGHVLYLHVGEQVCSIEICVQGLPGRLWPD